jgi:hypothetical protein
MASPARAPPRSAACLLLLLAAVAVATPAFPTLPTAYRAVVGANFVESNYTLAYEERYNGATSRMRTRGKFVDPGTVDVVDFAQRTFVRFNASSCVVGEGVDFAGMVSASWAACCRHRPRTPAPSRPTRPARCSPRPHAFVFASPRPSSEWGMDFSDLTHFCAPVVCCARRQSSHPSPSSPTRSCATSTWDRPPCAEWSAAVRRNATLRMSATFAVHPWSLRHGHVMLLLVVSLSRSCARLTRFLRADWWQANLTMHTVDMYFVGNIPVRVVLTGKVGRPRRTQRLFRISHAGGARAQSPGPRSNVLHVYDWLAFNADAGAAADEPLPARCTNAPRVNVSLQFAQGRAVHARLA